MGESVDDKFGGLVRGDSVGDFVAAPTPKSSDDLEGDLVGAETDGMDGADGLGNVFVSWIEVNNTVIP